MRIGASANTILACLARASAAVRGEEWEVEAAQEALRRAYALRPDIGLLCTALAEGGIAMAAQAGHTIHVHYIYIYILRAQIPHAMYTQACHNIRIYTYICAYTAHVHKLTRIWPEMYASAWHAL